jgi:Rab11 family-interacting protein 3/4
LADEMHRLRNDNRHLRTQNDELNAQLLHASIETGQSLLSDSNSLAVELHGKDKDEVSTSLTNKYYSILFS